MRRWNSDDYRAGFRAGQAWAQRQASRLQLLCLEE
jgi:hypothetical protein